MTSIATTKTTKPKKKTKKQIKLEKQQKMDEALLKINSDENHVFSSLLSSSFSTLPSL